MKKHIISVLAGLALAGSLAFADGLSFSNVVYTEVANFSKSGEGELSPRFAGKRGETYDQLAAGYTSEKVDVYAQARISTLQKGDESNVFLTIPDGDFIAGFGYVASKTYASIVYKPIKGLELGVHQAYNIPGAYFFVEDDTAAIGKLGSDGFNVAFTGVENLVVAASFDLGDNLFKSGDDYVFNTGFGAWYEFKNNKDAPVFSIGVGFEYARLDERGDQDVHFGAYGTLSPLEGLDLNFGFTINAPKDDIYLLGGKKQNALNASASYVNGKFYSGADFNLGFVSVKVGDENTLPFYTGAYAGFNISEKFAVQAAAQTRGYFLNYLNDGGDSWLEIDPSAIWALSEHHTFSFGAKLVFADDSFAISFPVKWTYKL